MSKVSLLYRQGMNELLAIILMMLQTDIEKRKVELKIASSSSPQSNPQQAALADPTSVVDETHLEADAYTLFTHLMTRTLQFYSHWDGPDDSEEPSLSSPIESPASDVGKEKMLRQKVRKASDDEDWAKARQTRLEFQRDQREKEVVSERQALLERREQRQQEKAELEAKVN